MINVVEYYNKYRLDDKNLELKYVKKWSTSWFELSVIRHTTTQMTDLTRTSTDEENRSLFNREGVAQSTTLNTSTSNEEDQIGDQENLDLTLNLGQEDKATTNQNTARSTKVFTNAESNFDDPTEDDDDEELDEEAIKQLSGRKSNSEVFDQMYNSALTQRSEEEL